MVGMRKRMGGKSGEIEWENNSCAYSALQSPQPFDLEKEEEFFDTSLTLDKMKTICGSPYVIGELLKKKSLLTDNG